MAATIPNLAVLYALAAPQFLTFLPFLATVILLAITIFSRCLLVILLVNLLVSPLILVFAVPVFVCLHMWLRSATQIFMSTTPLLFVGAPRLSCEAVIGCRRYAS